MNIRSLLLTALCFGTGCALLTPSPAWAAKGTKESLADLRKKEAQEKKRDANLEKAIKKNAPAKLRQNVDYMHKIVTILKGITTPEQANARMDALWNMLSERDVSYPAYYDYRNAPAAIKKEAYVVRREYAAQRHRLIESGIADAADSQFLSRMHFAASRWTDDCGSFDWPRCTWEETLAKRQAGMEEDIAKKWLEKNSEKKLAAGLQCSLDAYRKCLDILRGIRSKEDARAQKTVIWETFKQSWQGVSFLDHEEIPEPYLSQYIDVRDESFIEFYRICQEGYLADDPRFDEATPYLNYLNSAYGDDRCHAWVEEFHIFAPGEKALTKPEPPPTRTKKGKKKKKS